MVVVSQPFGDDLSPRLIHDLATGLFPKDVVFEVHGVTPETRARLEGNPVFQKALEQAESEWHSIGGTEDRIRRKAQLALEESLVHLYSMIASDETNDSARVAAVKELKDIASVAKASEGSSGPNLPSVSIVLNVGTKEQKAIDITPAAEQPASSGLVIDLSEYEGKL